MSDEAVDSMDAVLSPDVNIDADLTWDNVEDAAPSISDDLNEDGEPKDEWDLIDDSSPEDVSKDADQDREESESTDAEDKQVEDVSEPEVSEEDGSEDNEELVAKKLVLDELDDDATIMAKVDGELQEISIKEFKNGISGEKAIAKRFSEYDVKEKEFNKQMDEVNNYIADLGTTMKSSSVLEGVAKIGELTGMPSYQLKEALIKELLPEIEARYAMDDNELQLQYQKQENEYLKNKTESDNINYKAEQAQRELDDQVRSVRETHNINDEEWNASFSALDKSIPKDEIITPELVGEHVTYTRAESRAESLMESFDASYLENEEIMDAFVESVLDNPDWSDDDFASILKTSLEQTKRDEAEAKVVKANGGKEKVEAKKESKKEVEDEEEYEDWDEIY